MKEKFIILQSQINSSGNKKERFGKEKPNTCAICDKKNGCRTVAQASKCSNNRGKKKNKKNK